MKTQIQSKVAEVKQQLRQIVRPPQQQEVSGAGVDARYIGDTGTVGRNITTSSPKPSRPNHHKMARITSLMKRIRGRVIFHMRKK
ncbi:hypothetical protein ACNA06_04995 [Lysinibacillus sp. RSDA_15]|uniref:hypothetical protein n=1 Tax=Lysinibacillus sp. RSDA_15 TaxID=3391421 RepID=UPI003A4DA2B4